MKKITERSLAGIGLVALLGLGGAQLACRGPAGPAASAERAHGPSPAATIASFHCPMHPTYTSDKPGDCPICGMRLVPVEGASTPPAAAVSGRAVVSLAPERRQVLGLRSAPVVRGPLARTIRTVGRVVADETRVYHVHARFEAYVERLHVDYTGKQVRKGQPLVSLYSPELVATQQELLLALRAQRGLGASKVTSAAQGSVDLLAAARQRLLLWDVSAADVARLEETGEVRRTLDLHSEVSGWVVQKMAVQGMRVTPADSLFDIADYSRLWVMADVFESDLPSVRLGMPASLTMAYVPGRTWKGKVAWIAPSVEAETRTVKVRVEVDNARGELKPEMFADVELTAGGGTGLLAPQSAFLRSGERTLAFVDLGEGRFEPREVRLGARVAGDFEVLSGLVEGERVVTAASFLLDSESSLRAAVGAMSAAPAPAAGAEHAGHAPAGPPSAAPAGHSH